MELAKSFDNVNEKEKIKILCVRKRRSKSWRKKKDFKEKNCAFDTNKD